MLYAILCYNSEDVVASWSAAQDGTMTAHRAGVEQQLAARGKIGPVVRLMPTTTATTVRSGRRSLVLDGPFAETKEQLLGLYVVDCESLEEAIDIASELVQGPGTLEIRPIRHFSDASNTCSLASRLHRTSCSTVKRDAP